MTADRDLLNRFLADRDEAAFAELVRRHGPGVWGACRRRLRNPADAEDAFQAAFLVLLRRARRLPAGRPLGPWLGRVAALTARNVLRGNRRRAAVNGPMGHDIPAAEPAAVPVDLDAALLGLSEADRVAVRLCHLDGLSRKEAADRLGCPEGTLSARLSRALGKLRERLADEVPAGLVRSTVRMAVVAGAAGGTAGVSPAVVTLTEEAIRMLWVKKVAAAGMVLAAAGMVGLGVVRTADAGGQEPPGKAATKAAAPKVDLEARVRELERALEQSREENVRLRRQAERVTEFLDSQLAPAQPKKADKPAAKLDPPADPAADLQRQYEQAEGLAKAAAAQVAAAQAQSALAQQRLDHVRGQLKLARQKADKPAGADLRLFVAGDTAVEWGSHRFNLTERTADGPLNYGVSDRPALARLLTRATADPKGPKTVAVEVEKECKVEHVRAALLALKAAGFPSVRYDGPLEGDLLGTAKGPGAWTYDKAKRYEGPIDLADLPAAPKK